MIRFLVHDYSPLLLAAGKVSRRGFIGRQGEAAQIVGLRRCPARLVDLAIGASVGDETRQHRIIEVDAARAGRYDGATRTRLTLRRVAGHALESMGLREAPVMTVVVRDSGPLLAVEIGDPAADYPVWSGAWPALRDRIEDRPADGGPWSGVARIVQWHASRYYPAAAFADGDVDAIAIEVAARLADGDSLADANRLASRALYDHCRRAGWRKMTMRERARVGWTERGQWHRAEEAAAALAVIGGHRATGAGEATHAAAHGGPEATAASWSPTFGLDDVDWLFNSKYARR